MGELRASGLDPLIDDLARRHVPEEQVAAELELAWWRSALESLLEADRALLGANTSVLDRLEADFRLVDEAHTAGSAQLLARQLAETWRIGLVDWPDEAQALRRALQRDELDAFDLQTAARAPLACARAGRGWRRPTRSRPCVDTMPFDTVVLVDAGARPIAENVGAIRRAKQVVRLRRPGDAVARAVHDRGRGRAAHPRRRRRDRRHEASRAGTAGDRAPRPSTSPAATAPAARTSPNSSTAASTAAASTPSRGRARSSATAASRSTTCRRARSPRPGHRRRRERRTPRSPAWSSWSWVTRAVRPHESLMVVTASQAHAVRVLQAVLVAANDRPDLADFPSGDRAEPFTVSTIEDAVAESRDRVIFSIGYGRTPHGRVLSDFGPLGEEGGERLLAVAMTRARRSMTIVACFRPSDIDDGRMHHGAVALAEILAEVRRAVLAPSPSRTTATRCSSTSPAASSRRACASHSVTAASSAWSPRTAASARPSRPTRCCCAGRSRESLRLRPSCCAASAGTTRGCTRSSSSPTRMRWRTGVLEVLGAEAVAPVTEPIQIPVMGGATQPIDVYDPNATQPIDLLDLA